MASQDLEEEESFITRMNSYEGLDVSALLTGLPTKQWSIA